MNRNSILEMLYGAALVAACSGKLVVDDAASRVTDGGNRETGGAAGTGGAGGADWDAAPGGYAGYQETGGVYNAGGSENNTGGAKWTAGAGGMNPGGTAGCFSGQDPPMQATGGRGVASVNPTCPLDNDGFANVDLSVMCQKYTCPASSADLTRGLDCTEVTTDRTGFTKTVGCGFETVEFQSYEFRGAYDLEHEYAATYDLSTGELVQLIIKEPQQIEPCMSYAYKASLVADGGAPVPDCPSAVTYRCTHVAQTGAAEAPYAGCRAPDQAGCDRCCDPNDGAEYWAENSATIYTNGQGYNHACRCGMGLCATCKLEDERGLRVMIRHPECNCSLPPTGEPCASWCGTKPYWDQLCPGVL